MIASFIVFILALLCVIGYKITNFFTKNSEKKFFILINKFSNLFLLLFSGVVVFVIYCINSFKTAFENQNTWMINISILSYLLIYSFIFIIFILILLFIPFRTMIVVKKYKENKTLFKNNIKLFLFYGTILILVCTLMYAFSDPIIKIDYNYGNINYFDNSMIIHYLNLKELIDYTVKSEWVPWILISYTLIWMFINYFIVSKRSHFISENFINKINSIFSLSKYIIPIFCFISIVSTFILSWQSFFIRCLILLLVMIIFTSINFLLKFLLKNKNNDELHNVTIYNFMHNTIISILFIFYLCISSSKILSTLTAGQNVNLWFSIYISSLLISILSIANPNYTTNRIFACISTTYISSGINTFSLYFFTPIFELFSNINTDLAIKYLKLY